MVTTRVLGVAETVVVVTGALLVGESLHRAFMLGTAEPGSPETLLRVLVGISLVGLGYALPRVLTNAPEEGPKPGEIEPTTTPGSAADKSETGDE